MWPAARATRSRSLRWCALGGALYLATACGHSGSFEHLVFRNAHTAFRIGPLPGFTRSTGPDSNLAFTRAGQGVIGVHSTCSGYDDVPAAALAGHLLFGTTEREYLLDELAQVDGRDARHQRVRAKLDGVPVELELYVLVKGGCVYDLTHARPPGTGDSARRRFTDFVAAFTVLEP